MADGARNRVLVAAEDEATRNTLIQQLESAGFDVMPFPCIDDIIGRLPEAMPEAILVVPGANKTGCLDFCSRIKSSTTYRHIPIVLLLAEDSQIDDEVLAAAKIDDILVGSTTRTELLARMRSMVRIRQQYDELERTIEMRMALSYMIVHDVRNPLAAISLYMQLLKRKATLQPDQARYLDLALSEAQKMSSFLDDMLMLAKMERGKLSLSHSPLSIDRMCTSVHEKLAPLAETQGVSLVMHVVPQPQMLLADVTLFQRMMENLVMVALKRSPGNGTITINVDYPRTLATNGAAPTTPLVQLSVRDQGEPIPNEDLEGIFDQLEAVRLKERGRSELGLELAFCRMVVDAHSGRIFATNLPSAGVAFTVELF